MASVSYGLNRGEDQQPDTIHVGTQAVSTYAVELRIDKTKGLTRTEIALILEAFQRRLMDSNRTDLVNI